MSMDSLQDEKQTGDERVRDKHFAEIVLSAILGQLSDVHPFTSVAPDDTVSKAVEEMISTQTGCVLINA